MTGVHQSNHTTGGPAQAAQTKLCCYDGWLRPQIYTEEKVTYSAEKLSCINKGINNTVRKQLGKQQFTNLEQI
jgi:hypothetical protein